MHHAATNPPPRLILPSPIFLIIILSFAVGICFADILHLDRRLLAGTSAVMAGLIFRLHKYRTGLPKIFYCFLLGHLFFLLGLQHASLHSKAPADPQHISNLIENKQLVSIGGVLTKHPSIFQDVSGPETRFIMQAHTLQSASERQNKSL